MSENSLAAPAILGDKLLAAAIAYEKLRPLPASSGCALIDETALSGGFRYGEITSMAGASGTGKTLIAYHAIASHLLACEGWEAAVIDTTGSFSPLRLRDVLAFRLEARVQRDRYQQSGFVYENKSSRNEENRTELIDQATSMLDRVKVMRVFDFAGVVEAVAEVKETTERSSQREYMPKDPKTRTRDEVHDSEEEIDDDDTPSVNTLPKTRKAANGTIGMIIVDTITNVVSSVMSRSQVHGQALLASFMRSLHHLITHYHICTILTNAVVGVNPTKNPEYQRRAEEHVSIFSSTLGKPALGKSYTYLIDTSILISAVPKTNEDAVIASRSNLEAPFRKALVIEVVKDRFGAREGRWAPFEIVTGVKLVPCPG